MDALWKVLFTLRERFGLWRLLLLPLYPLTVLVATPVRLVQGLWSCRQLLYGRWRGFSHFEPYTSVNNLFYWSVAHEMDRLGRNGISPLLGTGRFNLSFFFPYTILSLYAFWGAGAVTVLTGMAGWWATHLAWAGSVDAAWLALVMGMLLISTTFYACTFNLQNYNALGWIFFPLGVYGVLSGNYMLAATCWFLAAFASFTCVMLASFLVFFYALYSQSLFPVLTVFPALLKMAYPLRYALTGGNDFRHSALMLLKAVGYAKRKAKYVRKFDIFRHIHLVYFSVLYAALVASLYAWSEQPPVLSAIGLGAFLLNGYFKRFMDFQSAFLFFVTLATADMLQSHCVQALPWYWLAISPLPLMLGVSPYMVALEVFPRYAPFSLAPLLEGMGEFLAPVERGQRILMAFADPGDSYYDVFDGYRVVMEAPKYVAVSRGIHLLPDWLAVMELNYEGAPSIWGRDVAAVCENLLRWNAQHVIVYQTGSPLDPAWEAAGFKTEAVFDWSEYREYFRDMPPFMLDKPYPVWWLLCRESPC